MGNSASGPQVSWFARLFRKGLDIHEQKCVDDIRAYGCHVLQVSAEGEHPHFSYSVGFPVSVDQPEVIVFGLQQPLMHNMINEMQRQCAEGLVMCDGQRVPDLIDGFDCILRYVTDKRAIEQHFGWAIWYHRSQRNIELCEAYQIVWPGKVQGLYPWEDGCDDFVIAQQPALYQQRMAA
jgi:hypothetical protein